MNHIQTKSYKEVTTNIFAFDKRLNDNTSHYFMYICLCNGITESDIRACAEQGVSTLRGLEGCLGVGTGCGKCRSAAKQVLKESHSRCGPHLDARTMLSGAPA